MENRNGYYRGLLETDGFRRAFVVFAKSDEHASEKALKNAPEGLEDAIISELEGPYFEYNLYKPD